jgi:hypothetical protein
MNELLRAAIHFTPEDLEANKQGRLTNGQKLRIEADFLRAAGMAKTLAYTVWAALVILVIVMLAVGLPAELTASLTKTSFKKEPDSLRWAVLGVTSVAGVAAAIFSLYALMAGKGHRNMNSNLPLYSVSGVAEKSDFEGWYTLKVGNREFVYHSSDPVYEAFEAGQAYNIYYIFNTSNIIVSAESVAHNDINLTRQQHDVDN